jgi:hypothetical protein
MKGKERLEALDAYKPHGDEPAEDLIWELTPLERLEGAVKRCDLLFGIVVQ